MNCPKCNGVLDANSRFCHHCGTQLQFQQTTNSTKQPYQQNIQQNNINPNHQEPSPFDAVSRMSEEEELIRAYIGKNNDKLYSNGGKQFNICALLFDDAYFLYRKMWGWFFIKMIGTFVVAIILSQIMEIDWLSSAVSLIFAFTFNNIYTDTVRKRITKIKEQNPDKTRQELVEICQKKGGTSVLAVVLYIVFFAVIGIIAIIAMTIFFTATINEAEETSKEKPIVFNDVSFTVASGLTEITNNGLEYEAGYIDLESYSDTSCYINVTKKTDSSCLSTNTCYENKNSLDWTIKEENIKNINGSNWYYRYSINDIEKEEFSEYYIQNKDQLYSVTFEKKGYKGICTNAKEKLEQTLKITN